MFETIILLASPVIVSWLVQLQKKLRSVKYSTKRKALLRVAAAIFSFLGVLIASLAGGEQMSEMYIQETVYSVLVFLSTQIPYWLGRNKNSV